jgi:glutamine synthetase
MEPEQLSGLGWDTKLPATLADAVGALEVAAESHQLDDLGPEFLKMYIEFKRLEAKHMEGKSEEERLAVFLKVF